MDTVTDPHTRDRTKNGSSLSFASGSWVFSFFSFAIHFTPPPPRPVPPRPPVLSRKMGGLRLSVVCKLLAFIQDEGAGRKHRLELRPYASARGSARPWWLGPTGDRTPQPLGACSAAAGWGGCGAVCVGGVVGPGGNGVPQLPLRTRSPEGEPMSEESSRCPSDRSPQRWYQQGALSRRIANFRRVHHF